MKLAPKEALVLCSILLLVQVEIPVTLAGSLSVDSINEPPSKQHEHTKSQLLNTNDIFHSNHGSSSDLDDAGSHHAAGYSTKRNYGPAMLTKVSSSSEDSANFYGINQSSDQVIEPTTRSYGSANAFVRKNLSPYEEAAADDKAGNEEEKLPLYPVILVPGDGGSRLQAKLDRPQVAHHYCERKSNDWFDLWLNLSLLVPFAIDCWIENMKMTYNTTTRRSSNAPGVSIRVQGFGSSDSVEFVDQTKVYGTSYFETIVKTLVDMGYERDKNILGAPYDFRRAPNELQDYFHDLNDLIEMAYRENGEQKAILICHSMGCLNSLYFLNSKPQDWKDKYIKSIVSLSGVWAGSVKAMKAFASGDNFGVIVIPSLALRKDIRTFPSLAYLLPSQDVWPSDEVLLKNKNRNYTVHDYKQFFDDIKYPLGYEMWKDVRNLTSPRVAPGVEVHCLHGHKVTTMDKLEYLSGEFPDTARLKMGHGDGDGTVNKISLEVCSGWKEKQAQPVHHQQFPNIDHMAILSDRKVMQYIGELLMKK